MPEPLDPIIVATGLPAHKSARLSRLAGAQLAVHEARDRFELATRIALAPPDVVLLDPVWDMPPSASAPSLEIGHLKCCPPPLLLWAGSSVFRGCATLRDVLDVIVRGVDDAPDALLHALSESRSAVAPQLIRCVASTLAKLPPDIAILLRDLLEAPDPLASSIAWSALLRLPRSTLGRHLQKTGLAPPLHLRAVVRMRLMLEHYRRSGLARLDLTTLPGAPSIDSVRHDLRSLGFASRRDLATATTGRFIRQSVQKLLSARTGPRVPHDKVATSG